jgi:hypothetical protein
MRQIPRREAGGPHQARFVKRRLFPKLLLFVTGLLLALLLAEAGLRVSGFSHFNPYIN